MRERGGEEGRVEGEGEGEVRGREGGGRGEDKGGGYRMHTMKLEWSDRNTVSTCS